MLMTATATTAPTRSSKPPGTATIERDAGGQVCLRMPAGEILEFWWGTPADVGTPAFWIDQTQLSPRGMPHQIASSVREEIAVAILGGFGMPAESGLAAFRHVKQLGLLEEPAPSEDELHAALTKPLPVDGRQLRYRFPRQRSRRLSAALARYDEQRVWPSSPVALRDALTGLPGIGPKSASWIVRNQTACSEVAIIDVHVHRAGRYAGFFDQSWSLPRDYRRFERSFLSVADHGDVAAADLDACIWGWMHNFGSVLR